MKNIKKLLALALVLVLALGMVPFVAASGPADMNVTDYSDFDAIEYVEAVDVLTALGVLQGDQGIFRPTDTITRAEAAKIIAYVRLGNTTAEALPVMTNNTFDDVRPDHWANKFVEYGAVQGIIGGFGDGTFRPEDPVTAIQMGKMLLAALGYGVNGEFEGTGWEIAVVDRARHPDVNVLVGTGEVDYSAPATREEVAHYTFNSLHRTWMVSWNSTINDYSFWSQTVGGIENRPDLGFSTFRLVQVFERDGYGVGGRVWEIATNRRQLTEWYQTDRILGTSTNGTPIDTLHRNSNSLTVRGRTGFVAELGRRWEPPAGGAPGFWIDLLVQEPVGGLAPTQALVPIYVNGIIAEPGAPIDREEALQLAATSGVIVMLCDAGPEDIHNGRIDWIAIIAKTVHEAGGPPVVATNGNVTIPGVGDAALQYRQNPDNTVVPYTSNPPNAVRIPANTNDFVTPSVINVRGDAILYPEGIERGDILLVHQAFVDDVYTIIVEKADSVTGQMTDVRLAPPPNITFGGQTFGQSGLAPYALFSPPGAGPLAARWTVDQDAPFAQPATGHNFDTDATIWLDDNGTVVRAKRVDAAPAIWGLVTGYEVSGALNGSISVRLTTADGNTSIYQVALRNNQTVSAIAAELDRGAGTGTSLDNATHMAYIVSYSLNDDEQVMLTFAGSGLAAGLGTTVPNTARFVGGNGIGSGDGATSGYTKQTTSLALTGGNAGARTITGSTAVFYYDASIDYSSTSPLNEPTAGLGVNSAVTDVGSGVSVGSIMSTAPGNTNNLVAVWFNRDNPNAGGLRYAFVTETGSFRSGIDRGTPWYDFRVFVPGGTPDYLTAEASNEFTNDTPRPVSSGTFGLGLYAYRLNTITERINTLYVPIAHDFTWSGADSGQVSYADSGIVTTINGSFQIDENTRFYRVNITSTTGRTTAQVIDFGDPYLNLPRQIPNVQYYVQGVQPTAVPENPVVAVYIEERSLGLSSDKDMTSNFASSTSAEIQISGNTITAVTAMGASATNVNQTDFSFPSTVTAVELTTDSGNSWTPWGTTNVNLVSVTNATRVRVTAADGSSTTYTFAPVRVGFNGDATYGDGTNSATLALNTNGTVTLTDSTVTHPSATLTLPATVNAGQTVEWERTTGTAASGSGHTVAPSGGFADNNVITVTVTHTATGVEMVYVITLALS